jgi:hypothetical protein
VVPKTHLTTCSPRAAAQQVNVVQLREKLNRRSQDQPRMAFSELLQLCIDS